MTIEALRERLAYWQRVLRLQDWDIVVEYIHPRDFENRTWLGLNARQDRYRRCLIQLADPAAYQASEDFARAFPYDPEQVLLHELLHCIVRGDEEQCEHAVEMLANALLRLERDRELAVTMAKQAHPILSVPMSAIEAFQQSAVHAYSAPDADPGPQA